MEAFLDESSRLTGSSYCYVIAAAVTIDDHVQVREAMRELRAPRSQVVHWHDENAARRREIVGRLAELDVHAFVHSCHPVAPKAQERVRARLLVAMTDDLAKEGVDHMVIEARKASLDKKDRATMAATKRSGIGRAMRYSHVAKQDEPLLWVADVIAGVVSLHVAGDDSSYFAQLRTSLLVLRQIEPKP